ncbi:MAG: hypothetical protein IPK60_20475 [Sandaracinaceae bacterium]|nr:hypothetical protein [Sandaracinaceae bacterium]
MAWNTGGLVVEVRFSEFVRRSRLVVATLFVALGTAASTSAQSSGADPLPTAYAWVHPTDGTLVPNPTGPDPDLSYINDPSQKFGSLQNAIDTMQQYLIVNYHPVDNPNQQGIIYALPGVYGAKSHDSLPIVMRDRVHVQGVGARRCVLRGSSTLSVPLPNHQNVAWPTSQLGPSPTVSAEVLVTYEYATVDRFSALNLTLPWWTPDAAAATRRRRPRSVRWVHLPGR